MLLEGRGAPKDVERAIALLKQAAAQDDQEAIEKLAELARDAAAGAAAKRGLRRGPGEKPIGEIRGTTSQSAGSVVSICQRTSECMPFLFIIPDTQGFTGRRKAIQNENFGAPLQRARCETSLNVSRASFDRATTRRKRHGCGVRIRYAANWLDSPWQNGTSHLRATCYTRLRGGNANPQS